MVEQDAQRHDGEEKTCLRCGETKLLTEFNKDKSRKDGHAPYCRACAKIRNREFYQSSRDTSLSRTAKYRAEHQDEHRARHREYMRAYRAKQRAERLEQARQAGQKVWESSK